MTATTPLPDSDRRKVFLSYTRTDRDWAVWIGCTLRDAGHTPFVHEWELPIGGNIPAWMEKRLAEADRAIGVFSDAYCDAVFSSAERTAAIWDDAYGATGFYMPVEVKPVTKWPVFTAPLSRLSLVGKSETQAEAALLAALAPPAPPAVRPPFPGDTAVSDSASPAVSDIRISTRGGDRRATVGGDDRASPARRIGRDAIGRDAHALARRTRAVVLADAPIRPSEPLPETRPPLPKRP